jgi:hypothetical protein
MKAPSPSAWRTTLTEAAWHYLPILLVLALLLWLRQPTPGPVPAKSPPPSRLTPPARQSTP